MSIEGSVVKEGKSVRDAIEKGLRSLSIREEQANIEIIEEGSRGFLGIGAHNAVVRVSIKEEIINELKLKDILVDLEITEGKGSHRRKAHGKKGESGPVQKPAGPSDLQAGPGPAVESAATVEASELPAGETAPAEAETAAAALPQEVEEQQGEPMPGTAAVVDGQLVVTNPVNNGSFATVKPDKYMKLTVNGTQADGETKVSGDDDIQLELIDDEPVCTLEFTSSQNDMEAFLKLVRSPGAKYRLRSQEAVNKLVLTTEVEEVRELPMLTMADLTNFLQEKGVVKGIDEEALQLVLDTPNCRESYLVARGQKPVDDVPGYIRQVFLEKSQEEEKDKGAGEDEGLFGRDKLVSVNAGDTLVVKVPKEPGEDGWNTKGEVLEAVREREPCELLVKNGCELVDNGNAVMAVISGRPIVETVGSKTTVSIDPIFVIKEVSQLTGDIIFTGDVEVQGDVRDGCLVEANGNVVVSGDVSRSTIRAGSSVVVNKMVIGSKIMAGGRSALYSSIKPYLGEINEVLKALINLARQEKEKTVNKPESSDGPIIQGLIDTRFSGLPVMVKKLAALMPAADNYVHEEVLHLVRILHNSFCGLGPLRICSIVELDEHCRAVEAIRDLIETLLSKRDSVKVRYVQNCSIFSSGDILIEGQGCFISSLHAGGEVIISGKPGYARGVRVTAGSNITVGNVGSEFETQTVLKIKGQGKITAEAITADVIVQIGHERVRLEKPLTSFKASLNNDGQLVTEGLSGGSGSS